MAISRTDINVDFDLTPGTSFVTDSIAPTTGRLVLAWIYGWAASGNINDPSLSGNGLTWVLEEKAVNFPTSGEEAGLFVFRAMGTTSAGGLTITTGSSQTWSAAQWSIFEYAGIDTSGTNGSGAVRQSVPNTGTATTTATVTLAAFGAAGNITVAGVGNEGATITKDADFTQIHHEGTYGALLTQDRNANDTNPTATWSGNSSYGIIGLEIVEAVAAAAGPGRRAIGRANRRSALLMRGGF